MADPILDRHIRAALIAELLAHDPQAAIHEELPLLRGDGRADVVCVNGHIAGFEIKSERDSLARLMEQVATYGTVCEYASVVVAPRHLRHARRILPKRWGIMLAEPSDGSVHLRPVRAPTRNAHLDKLALIRLMWKTECVRALRARGVTVDRNAPVVDLWDMLARLPLRDLCEAVRLALKSRGGSESGSLQTPSGDLGSTAATG